MYILVQPVIKRFSIAEARKNLPTLIRIVEKGAAVELTRRGKPVAILVSTKTYDGLTADAPDLWLAIEEFRRSADLEALGIDDVYCDVRDRTTGRDVDL